MHTFKASPVIPFVNVVKGVTFRENFFIPLEENNIYDLRYSFPVNLYNGREANKGRNKIDFKEKEFKKDFDSYDDFLRI